MLVFQFKSLAVLTLKDRFGFVFVIISVLPCKTQGAVACLLSASFELECFACDSVCHARP